MTKKTEKKKTTKKISPASNTSKPFYKEFLEKKEKKSLYSKTSRKNKKQNDPMLDLPNKKKDFHTKRRNIKKSRFIPPVQGNPVYAQLHPDTKAILDYFPQIVQTVLPLNSKQKHMLPRDIRELSHELTDTRSDRRLGYMNDPIKLSAYVRYFQWWNLVRFSHLFGSLNFKLQDGDAAVDLGSGPLTLPIALWISRPELRNIKLRWYCLDISQKALSIGEELFLTLVAHTGGTPWEIIKIKGEFGITLRRQVSLVASANMFNEIYWNSETEIEMLAKSHAKTLLSYAEQKSALLIIEPGIPQAGRFISLIRSQLLKQNYSMSSPCPHESFCPFPGLSAQKTRSKYSKKSKWCHFVLDTIDAPKGLHSLSNQANLPKERASLSFLYAHNGFSKNEIKTEKVREKKQSSVQHVQKMQSDYYMLEARILSEPIRLPHYYTGRYACTDIGMVLLKGTYSAADFLKNLAFGSLIEISRPNVKKLEIDQKSGAYEIII